MSKDIPEIDDLPRGINDSELVIILFSATTILSAVLQPIK